jgi:hypothetical protein
MSQLCRRVLLTGQRLTIKHVLTLIGREIPHGRDDPPSKRSLTSLPVLDTGGTPAGEV